MLAVRRSKFDQNCLSFGSYDLPIYYLDLEGRLKGVDSFFPQLCAFITASVMRSRRGVHWNYLDGSALKLPTRGERGLPSFKTALLWSDPVGAQRRRAKDLRRCATPLSSRPKHGIFPSPIWTWMHWSMGKEFVRAFVNSENGEMADSPSSR